jgi:hypothetical protein
MAWLVGDGFDTYAGAGELAISPNIWQSVSQCTLIGGSSVRFPPGVALQLGNTSVTAGNASTAQFANSQTIFVNANIISATAHVNGGFTETIGFTLRDTVSNIQCGLFLENGGTFVLVTGAINSGGIVRSPVLMPNSNQWAHIQVKIFIHNTAGTIELRINGSTGRQAASTRGMDRRTSSRTSSIGNRPPPPARALMTSMPSTTNHRHRIHSRVTFMPSTSSLQRTLRSPGHATLDQTIALQSMMASRMVMRPMSQRSHPMPLTPME